MTSAHHQQHTWTHTEAGTYLVRAVCASAPAVVNDDTQGRSHSRAVGNQIRGFQVQWSDCLFVHDDLPVVTGRGLRGSGPFPVSRNPTVGVSSPLTRAGRGLSADPLQRALPAFQNSRVSQPRRQAIADLTPFVAHQCAPFAANQSTAEGIQTDGYRGQSERSHCI